MSAKEVTAAVVKEIEEKQPDFICLNYANADMVGHTGVWDAVIRAVETVDQCVEETVTAALEKIMPSSSPPIMAMRIMRSMKTAAPIRHIP